jgi:hypothetical protein
MMYMISDEIGLEESSKLRGSIEFSIKQDSLPLKMEMPAVKLKKKLEIIVKHGKQRGNTGTNTAKLF